MDTRGAIEASGGKATEILSHHHDSLKVGENAHYTTNAMTAGEPKLIFLIIVPGDSHLLGAKMTSFIRLFVIQ